METNTIVAGSLGAIARRENKTLAESFLNCDIIVIVDTSGSMETRDSRGGRSRYAVACTELSNIQKSIPGKITVLAFSYRVQFCPSGVPTYLGGGTDLAGALKFGRIADVPGMRFFVISDGQPDDEKSAIDEARKFKNRIDTIYVGPEENDYARKFLEELAAASGGKSMNIGPTMKLEQSIKHLLSA